MGYRKKPKKPLTNAEKVSQAFMNRGKPSKKRKGYQGGDPIIKFWKSITGTGKPKSEKAPSKKKY